MYFNDLCSVYIMICFLFCIELKCFEIFSCAECDKHFEDPKVKWSQCTNSQPNGKLFIRCYHWRSDDESHFNGWFTVGNIYLCVCVAGIEKAYLSIWIYFKSGNILLLRLTLCVGALFCLVLSLFFLHPHKSKELEKKDSKLNP